MDIGLLTRAKLMQDGIYYIPPWLLAKLSEKQDKVYHTDCRPSEDKQPGKGLDNLHASGSHSFASKTDLPVELNSLPVVTKEQCTGMIVANENNETKLESGCRPRRGRKRKYIDQTRLSRKEKANTNQQYVSARGKDVKPKLMKELINCRCDCSDKIGLKERKSVFEKFWEAGSYEARCLLIGGMVSEKKPKRPRTKSEKKMFSRVYTFGSEKKIVCKKFFLESLCISSCTVHTALSKMRSEGPLKDKRGHKGGHNKLENERVEAVIKNLNKYPKYISHNCRSTNDQFLHPEVTLPMMYKNYAEETENPVSFASYKKIFYTKFTRKTLQDKCSTSDSSEMHDSIL